MTRINEIISLMSKTTLGRQILKNGMWWDISSLSLSTALLATRGNPDLSRARKDSQTLVTELLALLPNEATVLEFGCGIGLNSIAMAPFCRNVVGLDISPGLLRLARKLGKAERNVSFIGYDGKTFPFGSEMFDFVFSVGVFERIPKRLVERYLVEIQRVLKHNAKAFLYFLSHRAINTEFTTRLGSNSYFYYSQADSCSLISSSGMEVVRIIRWP